MQADRSSRVTTGAGSAIPVQTDTASAFHASIPPGPHRQPQEMRRGQQRGLKWLGQTQAGVQRTSRRQGRQVSLQGLAQVCARSSLARYQVVIASSVEKMAPDGCVLVGQFGRLQRPLEYNATLCGATMGHVCAGVRDPVQTLQRPVQSVEEPAAHRRSPQRQVRSAKHGESQAQGQVIWRLRA